MVSWLFGLILVPLVTGASCKKPAVPPEFIDEEYYADALQASGDYELRESIERLLQIPSKFNSYGCLWDILRDVDESLEDPSKVRTVFSGELMDKAYKNNGTMEGWNREHIWPKSKGFPSSSSYPYTDLHHVAACNTRVNSLKGNKDLLEGGDPFCLYPYGVSKDECEVMGSSTTLTFEPSYTDKGFSARSIFYMNLRYIGFKSDPNLRLVNKGTQEKRLKLPIYGYLCQLYDWHLEYPVAKWEVVRNEKVYQWQHNRNPFIDHPEWVDELFGDRCFGINGTSY